MSTVTIDRYLTPAQHKNKLRGARQLRRGRCFVPGSLLVRPVTRLKGSQRLFECDTVAQLRASAIGEFTRSLDLRDMLTSCVHIPSMLNNAHVHIRAALDYAIEVIPFVVTGLDSDNGSELINHDVIAWARDLDIYFTRSRPYRKNDQATIESKNYQLVRRYG